MRATPSVRHDTRTGFRRVPGTQRRTPELQPVPGSVPGARRRRGRAQRRAPRTWAPPHRAAPRWWARVGPRSRRARPAPGPALQGVRPPPPPERGSGRRPPPLQRVGSRRRRLLRWWGERAAAQLRMHRECPPGRGPRPPARQRGTRHPRALGEIGAPPGPGPVPPSPRARRAHLVLPLAAEAEARRPLLVALPVVRPRLVRLKFHHRGGDTPAAPGRRRRCRHGSALRVPPRSRDAGAGPLFGSGAGGTPVPAAELLSQQRRAVATAPEAAPRHRGSARRPGPARPGSSLRRRARPPALSAAAAAPAPTI